MNPNDDHPHPNEDYPSHTGLNFRGISLRALLSPAIGILSLGLLTSSAYAGAGRFLFYSAYSSPLAIANIIGFVTACLGLAWTERGRVLA